MAEKFSTFLMFEGRAEEAINLYASLFDEARIAVLERYGAGEQGPEGSVKRAELKLGDQNLMLFDSPIQHNFTFTPSISVFVECTSEEELDRLFRALSAGGSVLMPLDNYGFSHRFGWVADRFGVSWQLNLGNH